MSGNGHTESDRPSVPRDWYARSFDALYPVLYAHRSVDAAGAEAAFAAEQVGLRADDAVLDLCCGTGRHMAHLVERAGLVVGLDFSPDLLELVEATVGRPAPVVRADMRRIPFESAFDVVVNFFTSFGYFFSREENMSVAREVARALKPDGRFFIDYVNAAAVVNSLVPESEREQNGYTVRDVRWLDEATRRVNKRTEVWREGELVRELHESVRLYEPDEFIGMLEEGGLVAREVFGDYTGVALAESEPRMIVTGVRIADRR